MARSTGYALLGENHFEFTPWMSVAQLLDREFCSEWAVISKKSCRSLGMGESPLAGARCAGGCVAWRYSCVKEKRGYCLPVLLLASQLCARVLLLENIWCAVLEWAGTREIQIWYVSAQTAGSRNVFYYCMEGLKIAPLITYEYRLLF